MRNEIDEPHRFGVSTTDAPALGLTIAKLLPSTPSGSYSSRSHPCFQQKLAEQKDFDAFVEFVRGMNPGSSGKIPLWLMKFLLLLFMSSHERKQKLSFLPECLRKHQEEARLDSSYENYRTITAEVPLMYGGKYHASRLQLTMERLAAVLPRSEIHAFPKLDHFGIDQKAPQEVARIVSASFLKEQAGSFPNISVLFRHWPEPSWHLLRRW